MSFDEIVRNTFSRQNLLSLLGAQLQRVADGEADITLPFREELGQQSGTLHAGTIASIADAACGLAALTKMPAGSDVVSVEFKLNLLAPAIGERFTARARVIRAGKTLSVVVADVFADDETLVATMLATMMRRAAALS
jgi:uncharacterized protein (TIGR00369 family)